MTNEALEPLVARMPMQGWYREIDIYAGWVPLVLELNDTLAEIDPDYVILQVKEKFGGLRFYAERSKGNQFDGEYLGDPFFHAIFIAEARSLHMCRGCGDHHQGDRWNPVLCGKCVSGDGPVPL